MSIFLAHHEPVQTPSSSPILGAVSSWFEGPVSSKASAIASSNVYNGHLGVLRQENPTFERQRRYDFWFKP